METKTPNLEQLYALTKNVERVSAILGHRFVVDGFMFVEGDVQVAFIDRGPRFFPIELLSMSDDEVRAAEFSEY